MQERSDGSFFVQLVLGGKSKRVDSAKFVIGRIGDRAFDGSSAAAVRRLPQNTEEGFRLAHLTLLAPRCSLSRHRVLPRQGVCLCLRRPDFGSGRIFGREPWFGYGLPMSGIGRYCCKSILSISARNIDSKSSACRQRRFKIAIVSNLNSTASARRLWPCGLKSDISRGPSGAKLRHYGRVGWASQFRETESYGTSGRGCRSLRFDVGCSNHFAPLLSLIDYEGFKIGRGARKHRAS